MAEAKVVRKIVYAGTLQLDSPLMIGSGTETNARKNEADIHVLKDKKERPFIPGTSLAGVLRSWLAEEDAETANNLFGFVTKNKNTMDDVQSAVSIMDVTLNDANVVVRDGVSIDVYAGTGLDGKKYDYEAVERGASGAFAMTLTLREYHLKHIPELDALTEKIADRLCTGLRVGALTTKGFGVIRVPDICAAYYDFAKPADVKSWLLKQPAARTYAGKQDGEADAKTFCVDGEFALATSLLVRDQNAKEKVGDKKINAAPMKSCGEYLIPGTSLKGVLRHQAVRILEALGKPAGWLDGLMGFSEKKAAQKSRFTVNEVYIGKGVTEQEQTRNRIDRFTGGTIESALFTNKALWQIEPHVPVVKIHYEIAGCKDWEAGLALFLLKDLWTGKIPLGGEKSVGRGYLQGISARISFNGKTWQISGDGNIVSEGKADLESFAAALVDKEKEAAKE